MSDPTHIFDRERVARQRSVIKHALDLLGYTSTASFLLRVPNTTPRVYVVAGTVEEIRNLLETTEEAAVADL